MKRQRFSLSKDTDIVRLPGEQEWRVYRLLNRIDHDNPECLVWAQIACLPDAEGIRIVTSIKSAPDQTFRKHALTAALQTIAEAA